MNMQELIAKGLSNPQVLETYTQRAASSMGDECPLYDWVKKKPAKQCVMDTVRWFSVPRNRDVSKFTKRGVSPTRINLGGVEQRAAGMLHVLEEFEVSKDVIALLTSQDEYNVKEGVALVHELYYEGGRNQIDNERLLYCKAFTEGKVYLDSTLDIVESATSDTSNDIDLGIPAIHQGLLNRAANGLPAISGVTNIIHVLWSDPSADIPTQLEDMVLAAGHQDVPAPKHVWLHLTAKQYLRNNTKFNAWYNPTQPLNEKFAADEINIHNFVFHFSKGYYTSADGTRKPWIPVNKAIFTPELGNWVQPLEGVEFLSNMPLQNQRVTDIGAALAQGVRSAEKVFGPFALIRQDQTHPTLKLVGTLGSNYSLVFQDPRAIWQATIA
jgi:hypothetical protein